jgi:uncharacterized protein (TIGR02118 family)
MLAPAMVKVVTYLRRKPGMGVDEFQRYWRTRHPDVVKRLPGLQRYVQSHTLPSGYRKGEPVYDGIAEVWADSTDALREMTRSPAYAAVQADEARFLDREATGILVTEEHVIVDGPAPAGGVKNVEFVRRKPGMDVAAFQRYWRDVHGPIAARIPVIRRYVQSHTRPAGYAGGRAPAWDGVAIAWFESTDQMRVSARTPEYAATRADEPNFLSPDLPFIITREHVIVP